MFFTYHIKIKTPYKLTVERKKFLSKKSYLRSLYKFNYLLINKHIPKLPGVILEIGSGGGFFKDIVSSVITSDILKLPFVDKQINSNKIPYKINSIRAICGVNVIHHIPDVVQFLTEAHRVLMPRGRLVFIEPWPTCLSYPIYKYIHHEEFNKMRDWGIPEGSPLDAANGALPWIIFKRDEKKFKELFPKLKIIKIKPFMPFSYLISGGIEMRWPLPTWLFPIIRFLEKPFDSQGLFALIVIEKTSK